MMRLHRKNKRKGFTLIELLAVLVILAVVSAIAVPIFTNKDLASKQIAHNKTVETLVKQAYSYLLSKDTVTESDDIMQELIDNGYIKERPKYPLGDEEYLVRVDANGRVTVTPGMVEVTGVATGGSSGGEETPEEPEEPEEPEPEPEPIPPEGEQATVLNDVDGDGFKDIWYLEQLAYINTNTTTLAGSYELMRSLDFTNANSYLNTDNQTTWTSGEGWLPIGNNTTPFTGNLDGNNYKINNLYINRPTIGRLGLFGYTDTTVLMQNVGLEDVYVQGDRSIGGLIGVQKGTTNNCYTTGIVIGATHAGGLVGYQYGEVNNCYSTVNVTGTVENTGGLVGYQDTGAIISNCNATGDISGKSQVGGLVGYQYSGIIEKCYSESNVNGEYNVGGIVGYIDYDSTRGIIRNCYSKGTITGTVEAAGGLVGCSYKGSIEQSYSICNVNGVSKVGGLVGNNLYANITNSFACGNIVANNQGGAIAGYVYTGGIGSIINTYRLNTATVNGSTTNGTTTNNNGANRTLTELQSEAFLRDTLLWDLDDIWQVVEDNWPVFK